MQLLLREENVVHYVQFLDTLFHQFAYEINMF